MIRFIKRFLVFLLLVSLSLLSLFYIPREWYGHWIVGFLVWVILALLISWRSVPSGRQEKLIAKTAGELSDIQDLEEQVRKEARQLEMECPACNASASYWSFIDNFKCRSCGSDLFAARIKDQGEPWLGILEKREKIQTFYEKTPAWLIRKGKNRLT